MTDSIDQHLDGLDRLLDLVAAVAGVNAVDRDLILGDRIPARRG